MLFDQIVDPMAGEARRHGLIATNHPVLLHEDGLESEDPGKRHDVHSASAADESTCVEDEVAGCG